MVDVSTRRLFLKRATASGLAASAFASFVESQAVFVQESASVRDVRSETQFEKLADQYSLDPNITYLNHASIGTIAKPVQAARQRYLQICESNPWLYLWGGAWDDQREKVRSQCANLLSCNPADIAITHNTTEAFNILAGGLPLNQTDEVLFSSLCHAGASLPFEYRAQTGQYKTRRFDFPIEKLPDISSDDIVNAYQSQIKPETRVLVIPHMDNTVGVRYPVKAIAQMARAAGVEFVAVDAAQTVGMIPVDVGQMEVDLFATSPHKWLGAPKGLGLTYVNERMRQLLSPIWVTWGQERWGSDSARKYEDYGTRNFAELLTLGDAISYYDQIDPLIRESRLQELWSFAKAQVAKTNRLDWTSPADWSLAGSLYSIKIKSPAIPFARELFTDHGIVVRPFETMGLNNLRVSPNVFTSKAQIAKLIELAAS